MMMHQRPTIQSQPAHDDLSASHYENTQTPVVPWPDYLTVKETARMLSVSERSVYTYIEKDKLPCTRQGHLLAVETAAVRAFRRQASGRPRVRQPVWHHSPSDNGQRLTHIAVRIKTGQHQALEQRLAEIHANNRHQLPGTIARYIACSSSHPELVQIVLIWREAAMPPKEELLAGLEHFYEELNDVLDWGNAVIEECYMLLHT